MIESCCTDGFEVIFGYPLRMKNMKYCYYYPEDEEL
jgi:hypothetical protein